MTSFDSESFEELETLFHDLLERRLGPKEQRDEVAALEARDPALARELASLLAVHQDLDDNFLEPPQPPDLVGQRIGSFTLLRVLGAGGMGVVYEAEQDNPRRRVALKVVRVLPGLTRDLRRFRFEGEVMARLSHPNIAQVFDAGAEEDRGGTLAWIAMELIDDAQNLRQYCELRAPQTDSRLGLFAKLGRAVQYGHSNGVLHRDLKPDNVLVDDNGEPRVIDFGVAWAVDNAVGNSTTNHSLLTRSGDVVGTLNYMSPEQCSGAEPDTRSDIYSLGVILYELLTGKRPFELPKSDSRLSIGNLLELRERAAIVPLSRHSTRLAGDLETIVMTAIDPYPNQRYATVEALLEDLRRFRAHEPILAKPTGVLRSLQLFARRRSRLLASLLLVGVTLIVSTIVATMFGLRAERARALQARDAYLATLAAADGALLWHDPGEARLHLERTPEEMRGWEWNYLMAQTDMSHTTSSWPDVLILSGSVARNAPIVAAAATGKDTLRLWNSDSANELLTLPRVAGLANCCALSDDGSLLVLGYLNGTLELWDLATDESAEELNATMRWSTRINGFKSLDVSIDRQSARIARAHTGQGVDVFSTADGSHELKLDMGRTSAHALEFGPSGSLLYAGGGSENPVVRCYELESGLVRAEGVGHRLNVTSLRCSPDGSLVASGSLDDTLRLWEPESLEPVGVMRGHRAGVTSIGFSADSKTLASGSLDNTVRLWDPATLSEDECLIGHDSDVRLVGYRGSGDVLSVDRRSLRLWPISGRQRRELVGLPRGASNFEFRPDGGFLAVSNRGEVVTWDAAGAVVEQTPLRPPDPKALTRGAEQYSINADHTIAYGHRDDHSVVAFRLPDGLPLTDFGIARVANCISLAPDERTLAVAGVAGKVWVYALEPGEVARQWTRQGDHNIRTMRHDPSSQSLLLGLADLSVERRSLDGKLLGRVVLGWEPRTIAFDATRSRIAVGGRNGDLQLLTADLTKLAALNGHSEAVRDIEFSPDGTRLASASADGTVRIWEPEWGEQLLVLREHPMHAEVVRWSPDGQILASAGGDWFPEMSSVFLWQVEDE